MFRSVKDIWNVCWGCAFISLAFLLASCHNDPIVLNPAASLNIQLIQNKAIGGIESKSDVTEFDAYISIIYESDTSIFYGVFRMDEHLDMYVLDYTQSKKIYVSLRVPFRVHISANINGNVVHGESEMLIVDDEAIMVTVELDFESIDILPYVDLGLPSGNLWATCNLGASRPEEYGNYYSWDKKHEEYYYMPSIEDFEELSEYCTKTWTTLNNVNGYLLTGPNGNTMFLPAAGGGDGDATYSEMICGFYWLKDYYYNESYAWGVLMDEGNFEITSYYRTNMQTIRPKYVKNPTVGTENGHLWVDLGLPSGTKWATSYVGENPESVLNFIKYYAWGETSTKETYSWTNYKYCNGSENTLTKYCYNSSYGDNGFSDYLTTLDASDDVATALWGRNWRMPTYDELYELKTNCTAIYTGNSFMLTGPNGNSIFLPIGYSYDGMTVGGWISTIWSSMLDLDNPSNAWCLSFDDYGCNMNSSSRYYGRCVQPVYVSTRN